MSVSFLMDMSLSHPEDGLAVVTEQCLCRYDSNSGGEREIQRTMLELLNQLDGFDSRGDTKVRLSM